MWVIHPAAIQEYRKRYRDARGPLETWLQTAQAARWQSIDDVRKTYPHADSAAVRSGATVTIFNIKGNTYRLITAIHYNRQMVFIRDFMTHAEYSRDKWKERH